MTQQINCERDFMMAAVHIVEVGPRDGLQNIRTSIPTPVKLGLIAKLRDAGLKSIELTSVVSPKAIPQLQDCQQIMSSPMVQEWLQKESQLRLPVLVPNTRGLQVALDHGVREVAVFVSATESFSKANINCSVDEGLRRASAIASAAKSQGLAVRGYVSCIFADPYSGATPPEVVYNVVSRLIEMGCYQISLGDTLGVGAPAQVTKLLDYLFSRGVEPSILAGHFHDTYGQALANIWEAYRRGIRTFDSSVGGLGGCPFAPGAKGNVATEDVVYLFQQAGIETGVDLKRLAEVGSWISHHLNQANGSRAGSALIAKAARSEKQTMPQQRMNWSEIFTSVHILVHKSGANGKITLNQPAKGNVLSLALISDFKQAFRKLEADATINRIIITANGKYFCTGMNLGQSFGKAAKENFDALLELFEMIDTSGKVTIACINGPAFGGGIGLAFACDIRISLRSVTFTLSEVKLGLCPAIISKYVLREFGVPRTREAMLSARAVSASELHSYGIIRTVAETSADLDLCLDNLLKELRHSSPGGSKMSKELVRIGWSDPNTTMQQQEIARLFREMTQPDSESAIGIAEFQKKRAVDWDLNASIAKSKL
ncbi:unnamed protein product [Clonostachys rosea]|uniref:hydroxymethylglutaryl-CoA lyase n=1 Tax=Bionectria ochroleuca TaxID=29856 RepID=A0ABY6U918_BIOOC|nr:unnamed protein product [Clonostachys rosea]